MARTVGAVRRPERPRLAPAALAGARPWSWRLAALGPTSPTRPTATASSVTVRRGKTNQEGEDAGRAFVKGGVARAGCRRRGRAGGNRSGAADLAAVLVTCHRRGVAGRWRRVGEKIALEGDRLDAVIASSRCSSEGGEPGAGGRRPGGGGRRTGDGLGHDRGGRPGATDKSWPSQVPSALGERAPVDHTPRVVPTAAAGALGSG